MSKTDEELLKISSAIGDLVEQHKIANQHLENIEKSLASGHKKYTDEELKKVIKNLTSRIYGIEAELGKQDK